MNDSDHNAKLLGGELDTRVNGYPVVLDMRKRIVYSSYCSLSCCSPYRVYGSLYQRIDELACVHTHGMENSHENTTSWLSTVTINADDSQQHLLGVLTVKTTKITLLALAIVGMMIAHPSMAQAKKGMFGNVVETFMPPKGDGAKMIAKELELDEEQRPKMKELNERFMKNASTLRQGYQQAYENVVTLMNTESPNKSNVNDKLKSFHAMHQKVLDAEVSYWMDLKEILTPAQNLKLWEIFEKQRIRR